MLDVSDGRYKGCVVIQVSAAFEQTMNSQVDEVDKIMRRVLARRAQCSSRRPAVTNQMTMAAGEGNRSLFIEGLKRTGASESTIAIAEEVIRRQEEAPEPSPSEHDS